MASHRRSAECPPAPILGVKIPASGKIGTAYWRNSGVGQHRRSASAQFGRQATSAYCIGAISASGKIGVVRFGAIRASGRISAHSALAQFRRQAYYRRIASAQFRRQAYYWRIASAHRIGGKFGSIRKIGVVRFGAIRVSGRISAQCIGAIPASGNIGAWRIGAIPA